MMDVDRLSTGEIEPRSSRATASVVDLFCGAGAMSYGFKEEGFPIAAGVDIEEACRYPFERNNGAPMVRQDIATSNAEEINDLFYKGVAKVLVGCAPCQPFSSYNKKNSDDNWRMVDRLADIAIHVRPDILSMENVANLLEFDGGALFRSFRNKMTSVGYNVHAKLVYGPDYGLPQRRTRLVVLASRLGPIQLELPQISASPTSALDAIGHLPPIAAGEAHPSDILHRASALSPLNLQRIKASVPGGTWLDWNPNLRSRCHTVSTGRGYGAVYGRMAPNVPAPTITTQFYGFGNGRFGHPSQDRGLSLREGAILQSFPLDYAFVQPGRSITMKAIGKLIGNAVPVLLSRTIARTIANHLRIHSHV